MADVAQRPQLPLHIDSTMIACARSCMQKFYLEFVLGYRPAAFSIDLHAGACFATALETTYRRIHLNHDPLTTALQYAEAQFAIEWGDFEIPEHKRTAKTRERMWEAVEDYFAKYPPLTDHVQPYTAADGRPTFEYTFAIPLEPAIHPGQILRRETYKDENAIEPISSEIVERTFPLHPSGQPWLYCGRFDMLGSLHSRPVVRDEKTTGSSIGQGWSDQWNLRSQFIGYTWACQQGGIDLDTVVVRGIAIQKTQFVHAEAIKTYSDLMRARWLEQLRRDLWRIRRAWDEGYWDYNLADACSAYGGCVFRDVCQSSNAESWLSNFTIKHWNPLEKNPVREVA